MKTLHAVLLLILSISFIDAALNPLKRKFQGSSRDNFDEDSDGDTVESDVVEPFSKRPKNDPNAEAKVFTLPHHVLALIGSFLQNPFKNVPHASFDFYKAMNLFSPQYLLQSRTNFDVAQIQKSPELAFLLELDRECLNERFNQLLFPGSIFTPQGPLMVEYAANVIRTEIPTSKLRKEAVLGLASYLISINRYDSLFALIKSFPEIKFNPIPISEFLTELVNYVNTNFGPEGLNILKGSQGNIYAILVTLASLPVSFETLELQFANILDPATIINILAASCSIKHKDEIIKNRVKENKSRNKRFLDSLPEAPVILVTYAEICFDLRYSAEERRLIPKDFFDELKFYVFDIDTSPEERKEILRNYHRILVLAALLGGKKNIFRQLINHPNFSSKCDDLRKYLKDAPEFFDVISRTNFTRIFGVADQDFLVKSGKLPIEDVSQIKNIPERIRVLSEIMTPEQFIEEIKRLYNEEDVTVSEMIHKIVSGSRKNPARIVHHILTAFKDNNFRNYELNSIAKALGSPEYLKSLLSDPENVDILTLPSPKYFIILQGFGFRTFLSLANKLKQDRAANLRERFQIFWTSVFHENNILPHELIKLFDIFGIEIGDFNTDMSGDDAELAADLLFKNSRILFSDPESMSRFTCKLLVKIAENVFIMDEKLNKWHIRDIENPLLLKSYAIYKIWMERNIRGFIAHTPIKVLQAFKPEISDEFLMEVIFNPEPETRLLPRILRDLIPPNTEITLTLDSIVDFRTFFFVSLPFALDELEQYTHFTVIIEWVSIIESSRNFADFEAILSVIKEDELKDLGEVEPKSELLVKFLDYFVTSNPHRVLPQINRDRI